MSDDKSNKKNADQYKEKLNDEQYQVCWNAATERAFTGKYWDCEDPGTYCCVCCEKPLFDSKTKFDSGTGWPSFWKPVSEESVKLKSDKSLFMERIEVLCGNCGAHLGHVFSDGPKPTGKRFCMNSASLVLKSDPNESK